MSSKFTIITGKTPTPQRRFRDYNSIVQWLQSSVITKNTINVDDYISDVPKYIDIPADIVGVLNVSRSAYAMIENDYSFYTPTYFCFITKIEYSNVYKSIRCYFSIDWWDTLIYAQAFDTSNISVYGDIIRAHVQDVEKDDSGDFHPTLKYTTNEMEVMPDTLHTSFKEIACVAGGGEDSLRVVGLMFVIVPKSLFKETGNKFTNGSYSLPKIRNYNGCNVDTTTLASLRQSNIAQQLSVIPFFYKIDTGEVVNFAIGWGDGLENSYISYKDNFNIADIKTDQVCGVYFYPSLFSSIGWNSGSQQVFINQSDPDYWFNNDFVVNTCTFANNTYKEYFGITSDVAPCISFPINFTKKMSDTGTENIFKSLGVLTSLSDISKPADFNEYLENGIIKYKSQAYNSVFLDVSQDYRPINYNRLTSSDTYIKGCIDLLTGTVLAIMYDENAKSAYAQVNVCTTNWITPPPVVDSYWDRYTASMNATKNGFGIAQGALQVGQGYLTSAGSSAKGLDAVAEGKVGLGTVTDWASGQNAAAIQVVKGAENIALNAMALVKNHAYANGALVQGNVNGVPAAGLMGQGIPKIGALTVDDDDLRYNLMLYGYNTHLNLNTVLKDTHKRKYYNFIRTNGAYILDANCFTLIPEAKDDICNMFDSGVFLFTYVNTQTLFELEVPNYCSIMDEV